MTCIVVKILERLDTMELPAHEPALDSFHYWFTIHPLQSAINHNHVL